jgi:3-hydroxy-9,10-secoandrosta-1,3,5(10)-triene-9,17-dione monooxygenase
VRHTHPVEVLAALGQGDGSTAWVAWVLAANTWLVGLFPDAVADEVFATPDVCVSGTLSPTGKVERRDDGFVLNGEWHFHSGSLHSQWSVMAAMSTTEEGIPEPVAVLIPTSDMELLDDWDTAGLRGRMGRFTLIDGASGASPWRDMQWEDGA